jgi:hypothetical protein
MSDEDRIAALDHVIAELARILERGLDDPDAWVRWTGRQMKVAWFAAAQVLLLWGRQPADGY